MNIGTEGAWQFLVLVSLLGATVIATDTERIVEGSTHFSLDLMKAVFKEKSGNVIMSPLSVSTLMAMLQQGANNVSATELQTVLHLKKDVALRGFQALISDLKKRKSSSVLEFGNSMYVNQDFDLVPEYKQAVQQSFHAAVEPANFRNPVTAAKNINDWVSLATKGRIPDIVKPTAITGRTELIMVNAIFFKGTWLKVFRANETRRAPFTKSNGQRVTADMMTLKMIVQAGEDDLNLRAKWIELPYTGFEYAMVLVLPNDNGTLQALVDRMSFSDFTHMMQTRTVRDVTLNMPKLKLSTDISLVPSLQSLGLTSVFNQNSNLEGISITKGPLIVSDVLHKAELEVTEEGSVATAVSAVVVNTLSISPEFSSMDFNANQPFLAIIVDKSTLLPIFVAKIADPTST